jgi:hypothetical protein
MAEVKYRYEPVGIVKHRFEDVSIELAMIGRVKMLSIPTTLALLRIHNELARQVILERYPH